MKTYSEILADSEERSLDRLHEKLKDSQERKEFELERVRQFLELENRKTSGAANRCMNAALLYVASDPESLEDKENLLEVVFAGLTVEGDYHS